MRRRPMVLIFAGLDPSGGAGIGADMEAVRAQGCHPLAIVTALTVQDNNRVYEVQPVDAALIRRQTRTLLASFPVAAVKIGIPGSLANADAIASLLPEVPIVVDPVLASGQGDALAKGDALAAARLLLAHATLATPNGPEAEALGPLSCPHLLLTGGHGNDPLTVTNHYRGPQGARSWSWPRLDGQFHGSGCTLAAAVAARLALGEAMELALDAAQTYTYQSLAKSYAIGPGQRIPERAATFI